MGQYSTQSHVPILLKLFNTFDISSVFEFGIGLHSTPIFIDNCKKVLSIEMNSFSFSESAKGWQPTQDSEHPTWYQKVVNEIGNRENWEHCEMHGPDEAIVYAHNLFKDNPFDLVFADGHGATRNTQTNSGFGYSRFIICHDSQHHHTRVGWNVPEEYTQIDFVGYCRGCTNNKDEDHWPITTIFCMNKEDADIITTWLDDEKSICSLHFLWPENR